MKMLVFALSLVFLFAALPQKVAASPHSNTCECIADIYTKKYISFEKTWYGTKRIWTCEYTCSSPRLKEFKRILGKHSGRYVTDKGNEGICDGVPVISKFNTSRNEDIYVPQPPVMFSPLKSSSPELKSWAKSNCQ